MSRGTLAVVAALSLSGCADIVDPRPADVATERCEGGLAPVDGECVLLSHAMEVLMFRTTTSPYVSTCTRTITSADPGIEPAIVAEGDGCRVIDTDLYGPANFEPGPREAGVTVERDGVVVAVDEAELFQSCIERTTLPETFFAFDGDVAARFGGSTEIPSFELNVRIPADPAFTRSPLVDGDPLVFEWRAVPGDRLSVVVAELPVQIVCEAPISAERIEVPAEFIAMLPESDPPGLEPVTSIRVRNETVVAFPERDAVVTIAAEAYQSAFP